MTRIAVRGPLAKVICDVCGRNNADDLTFCQDCGRRLKPREQRVVPPTPPTGLPKVALPPVPAPTPAPQRVELPREPASPARPGSTPPARSPARTRPEAPTFSFAPASAVKAMDGHAPAAPAPAAAAPPLRANLDGDDDAAVTRHAGAPASPDHDARAEAALPATVAMRIICASCEAENPPGYRFCVTCGAPLAKAAPKPATASDAGGLQTPLPPLPPPPAAYSPATMRLDPGGDKIVGSPVLDIAVARHAPARLIECARCHGHCAAGTRFCKYCGAPLEADRAGPSAPPERAAEVVKAALDAMDAPAHGGARAAPLLGGIPVAGEPRFATRPSVRDEVTTLPSSVETTSAPVRSSPGPQVPVRSPYSVRPASQRPEPRVVPGTRTPEGKLVVIVEDGSEGKSFSLTGKQIDVGRTEGDILLEDDLYVSPRHARLVPQEGGWLLRDLGSVNRIYLRIRKPHTLRDADLLLLGLEVLQFQTVSDGERGLGHAIQHGTLLFGSPAIQRRARLCQKTVEGVTRDVYHLYRDETVIGRETGDIVFTSDPFLSRRHAVIRRNPATGDYSVADLDSSNGTYVAIREDVSLVNGDFVRIGQHLFRVDLS